MLANDQHPVLAAIQEHILRNIAIYGENLTLVVIAGIISMPERCPFLAGELDTPAKVRIQQFWSWIRDTLQTAIPARFRNHPPGDPAQLQK